MRTLTVKMEEIESTAISTSRVTIKKMETRIEELEVLYDREKKMHVETMSALHKKDRYIIVKTDEAISNLATSYDYDPQF